MIVGAATHLAVLGAFALTTAVGAVEPATHASSADRRIEYYRARVGGPGTYPAYARLGLAYVEKARESGDAEYYDRAIEPLRKSLEYQRNFDALLGMALALSERHRFREALPYAQEALGAMPGQPEAQGVLVDVKLALGDAAAAEAIINAMVKDRPGFHAYTRLAALREGRGDLAGAVRAMEQAHQSATSLTASVRAWTAVRIGALQLGRCAAANARAQYETALQLVPDYYFAREHLAEWHAAHGHWADAENLYRALLKTRPDPQYRLALAAVYRQGGKNADAERERQTALNALRRDAARGAQDQLRPLALALLERDETAGEALAFAERDWSNRHDAFAADTLAWALSRNGRHAEALRTLEPMLKAGTKSPTVLLHAGLISAKAGRAAQARELIQQALACPLALVPGDLALAMQARAVLAR